eukprot:2828175-Pyramimonas_sp.AAC.1
MDWAGPGGNDCKLGLDMFQTMSDAFEGFDQSSALTAGPQKCGREEFAASGVVFRLRRRHLHWRRRAQSPRSPQQ